MSIPISGTCGPAAASQANHTPCVTNPLTLVFEHVVVDFEGCEIGKAHFWIAIAAGNGHEIGCGIGRRIEGRAEEVGAFGVVEVDGGGEVAGGVGSFDYGLKVCCPHGMLRLGESDGVDAGSGVDGEGDRTEEFIQLGESSVRSVDLSEDDLVDVAGGDDLRCTSAIARD